MRKKLCTIALSLSLLLGLFPVAAFAENVGNTGGEGSEQGGATTISNIAVKIKEPVVGEDVDYTVQFTATPKNSLEIYHTISNEDMLWAKVPVDEFKPGQTSWTLLTDKDTKFEEGYIYAAIINFLPAEGYTLPEGTTSAITGTINGKECNEVYIDTWADQKYVGMFNYYKPKAPSDGDSGGSSNSDKASSPSTGDSTNYIPWISLAVVSNILLVTLLCICKKRKQSR